MEHYPTWPNLPAMMFALARTWPDKPLLRCFRDGAWHSIAWGEFGRMAASCARHLRAAGVAAGDRVVIVSENRPEYPIAETALMALRAVPVPTYITNTVADHAHILRDSGARAAIVSTPALAGALREAGRLAGGLDLLVVIDGTPEPEGRRVAAADALGEPGGRHAPPDDIALEAASIPASCARLPDLHVRHRRRAQGRDAAAPLDPVELPRRVRADAAAAVAGRGVSVLPAGLAQLRTHGRHVLPAEHRHRDRLLPRGRASGGRYADGAPDHPHRGAARAGGDPQPHADAGGAPAARGSRRCSGARWNSG